MDQAHICIRGRLQPLKPAALRKTWNAPRRTYEKNILASFITFIRPGSKTNERNTEYEKCRCTKLGRLVASREIPVLKRAKELLDEANLSSYQLYQNGKKE